MYTVLHQVILQGVDSTPLKALDVCSGDALWLMSPSLGTAPVAANTTAPAATVSAAATAEEAVGQQTSLPNTASVSPADAGKRASEGAPAPLLADTVHPDLLAKCPTLCV